MENAKRTPRAKAKKYRVVNIRIEQNQRDLIDAAASLCGKSRSAFMLDAATSAAQEALLERRLFVLNEKQWEAVNLILDRPAKENPRLKKLLTEPGIFD